MMYSCATKTESNPFFTEFQTQYGVPSFDKIKLEHYEPAFLKGIEEQNQNIEAIIESPEIPTFENTIVALDNSAPILDRVSAIFFNMTDAETTDSLTALSIKLAPVLSEHDDNISLNEKLFKRVNNVYQKKDSLNLTSEQERLLDKTYKRFVRSGANLNAEDQTRLREINKELSTLGITFSNNILNENNAFKLFVDKEEDLAGLPEWLRQSAAEEARAAGNEFIIETYGEKYLPKKPRYFKSKSNIQDGHEAIRPSMPKVTPEQVKPYLTSDQYKIYKLVWERFIASLMESCMQETMKIEIEAGEYIFTATGYTVKFDGFTKLYEEKVDDEKSDSASPLPALKEGDELKLKSILGNQHFTQPPARYTEASLTKALEENGVGRPSTYVTITSTILNREYVKREGKQFVPTELGEAVTNLLKDKMPNIVNVKYTSKMEADLDKIDSGEKNYKDMIRLYYDDFEKPLEKAKEEMQGVKIKLKEEETDEICEKCGRNMVVKVGRFGKFLACPGYPECKNTKPLIFRTKAKCPECGGDVIEKKTKRGSSFYGCSNYPKCNFMTWDAPSDEVCPRCGKSLFKRKGNVLYCPDTEGCGFTKPAPRKKKTEE